VSAPSAFGAPPSKAGPATPGAVAWRLAAAITLLFLASAGGRITASDEYTMYRLTEALVTRGSVAVEAGNAERGPDGRLYPKAALGQALAAAPFYAVGRAIALPVAPARRDLVVRAVTSLLNPFVSGALAAVLFLLFLTVGASPRAAFFWTGAALLTTPLWVYGKSFLTEPLLALGLSAGLLGALRFREGGGRAHALLAGAAWGATVLVKYAMLPAVLLLAWPFVLAFARRPREAWPAATTLLAFAAIALAYNAARTGTPFGSGYGRQATAAAFSTPLYVGLYGLLVSSGKGLAWFAPLVALAPAAFTTARRRLGTPAVGIALAVSVMTVIYATFEHWAGDGSWGPRYLVPFVPLLFVLLVAAESGQPWRGPGRRLVVGALAVAGLLVQLGGVGIYFGAQMREAGDYPYTKPLSDPSFMVDSHFNPARSPIAGHARMLGRNVAAHLRGDWPEIRPSAPGAGAAAPTDAAVDATAVAGVSSVERERLALPPAQVEALTRGLDFWWTYAAYAGLPRLPLLAAALALLLAAAMAARAAWRALRRLEVRPLPQAPDTWIA
jgi:hypothetical protein